MLWDQFKIIKMHHCILIVYLRTFWLFSTKTRTMRLIFIKRQHVGMKSVQYQNWTDVNTKLIHLRFWCTHNCVICKLMSAISGRSYLNIENKNDRRAVIDCDGVMLGFVWMCSFFTGGMGGGSLSVYLGTMWQQELNYLLMFAFTCWLYLHLFPQ